MNPLTLIDLEIEELRWAMGHYFGKGQRQTARDCYHELQGLRRARAIVVRCADSLEKAA